MRAHNCTNCKYGQMLLWEEDDTEAREKCMDCVAYDQWQLMRDEAPENE